MFKYLDKTFFKFFFGFITILMVSFLIISFTIKNQETTQQASVKTSQ